jgi:transposase-like protein
MKNSNLIKESQKKAAYLLALGSTGRDVAKVVKIDEATISRWRSMPKFKELIKNI